MTVARADAQGADLDGRRYTFGVKESPTVPKRRCLVPSRRSASMTSDFLVHATGIGALAINVIAMARTCEKSLRLQSAVAGLAWSLNNFLLGAYTAAALSLVSAGRTSTSAAVLERAKHVRRAAFFGFSGLTLGVAAATWNSQSSLLITVASLLSTYAMFFLTGPALRWSMLVGSALWMDHAWSHGSWEQIAANAITGLAALYGVWRVTGSPLPVLRLRHPSRAAPTS